MWFSGPLFSNVKCILRNHRFFTRPVLHLTDKQNLRKQEPSRMSLVYNFWTTKSSGYQKGLKITDIINNKPKTHVLLF